MGRPRRRARGRKPQRPDAGDGTARLDWEVDILLLAKLLPDLPPGMQRLGLVVVGERGSGLVVGAGIADPDDAGEILETAIREAFEAPAAGPPRRPARILVRRPEVLLALRLLLAREGIPVERVGLLSVVDDVAAGLARELVGSFASDTDPVMARIRLLATMAHDELPGVLERLSWSLFRAPAPFHVGDEEDELDFALARLTEWALFIAPVGPGRSTLSQQALERLRDTDPETYAEFSAHLPARYALLRINGPVDDATTSASDLWTGEDLRLARSDDAPPAQAGSILIGTIFPAPDGRWRFGGALFGLSAEAIEICPRPTEHETAADMPPLVERNVVGADTGWILTLRTRKDLGAAWQAFRTALAGTGTRLPAFDQLLAWMKAATRQSQVYPRLEGVGWWTIQEVEVARALLDRIWSQLRKPERRGDASDKTSQASDSPDRQWVRDRRAAALQLIEDAAHGWITPPVRLIASRYIRAIAKNHPDRYPGPLPESWAAGAIHAAFLLLGKPRLAAAPIADLFGVSPATVNSRSLDLRNLAPGVGERNRMELFTKRLEHVTQAGKLG